MNHIWIVASHEFWTNLKKPSFLWAVFGVPLFMTVLLGLVFFFTANIAGEGDVEANRIGYLDQSANNLLADPVAQPDTFIAYDDLQTLRDDLEAGEIDVYFTVPGTYMALGNVQVFANGSISTELGNQIEDFLAANVAAQIDSDAPQDLLRDPTQMQVYLETSQRLLESEFAFLGLFFIPFIFSFVIFMALQLTSNFLMSSVVEEKANRIMEILITTVTPAQLLTGKLIGLGALGLVQLGVWAGVGALGFAIFGDTQALSGLVFPVDLLLLALLYFILAYFLFGSILAGIGAIVGSEQESRAYAGILSLVLVVPFIVIAQFISEPNGPLATFMSLFPLTAPVSMILRTAFTSVPTLEIILSIALMILTMLATLWASAKIFRWALLLYGKRVGPRDIWTVLRRRVDSGVVVTQTAKE